MVDLDSYLRRIGLSGRPALAELHRAHVSSIPFENLDPLRGVPVLLDPGALQDKLVSAGRGGYCFEQNLLLKGALEALGARAEPVLARVRWNARAGVTPARSHAALRVELDGETWLADVGFGAGTLIEPIPFGVGGPYEQAGWRFRVVEDGGEWVLQTELRGEWRDLYAFDPRPVPQIDLEVSNWFTSTHPTSRFVTQLIVSTQRPDGTRVSLSDTDGLALVVSTPADRVVTSVDRAKIPQLLEAHFGLAGFAVDGSGAITPDGPAPAARYGSRGARPHR